MKKDFFVKNQVKISLTAFRHFEVVILRTLM
jgi:hypothetical protein